MSPEIIKKHYSTTQEIIAQIAGIIFIIPLAPFICRFIPPVFAGSFNIDLIISVVVSIVIVRLMLWLIKPMILPAVLLVFGLLAYNQANNNQYTFQNVASDYKTLVSQYWLMREQKQTDQLSFNPHLFENVEERTSRLVIEKVQYKDSIVRNFSVKHSLENFDNYHYKYGELARYFSLFKYINSNFKYVPDAKRDEYYATPQETILNGFGGDCDDHSILMAACLMSIGAKCRLIIIEGHMYPEIYAGNKKEFDIMQQAIIQFFGDFGIDRIYFHENDGEYWVNLDYSADYPGGPYMNDNVKLLINIP
ncbi:MAG TPA: transglutaminase family protein [Panacibacter sp.]|nr:transglutaminase family protein [Panacibacter sp.]